MEHNKNHFGDREHLAHRADRYAPLGYIRRFPGYHLDAVYDWTDAEAERTASAAVSHKRQVGLWIKCYGLVSRVITGHVTFPTVDAHVLIYQSLDLLFVVEFLVRTNVT